MQFIDWNEPYYWFDPYERKFEKFSPLRQKFQPFLTLTTKFWPLRQKFRQFLTLETNFWPIKQKIWEILTFETEISLILTFYWPSFEMILLITQRCDKYGNFWLVSSRLRLKRHYPLPYFFRSSSEQFFFRSVFQPF